MMLLPGVVLRVALQICEALETLLAEITLVCLLLYMRDFVPFQTLSSSKHLFADLTLV